MAENETAKPRQYPWSASRIGCFAECALKYKLNYVEGWKSNAPVNTQLADKGSAFHETAEKFHTGMTKEEFVKILNENTVKFHVNTTDPDADFYYNYDAAVEKFFAFWDKLIAPLEAKGYKVGQELKVNNIIHGEAFTGSLDLCVESYEFVVPDELGESLVKEGKAIKID